MFVRNRFINNMFNKKFANQNLKDGGRLSFGGIGLALGMSAMVAVPGLALAAPVSGDAAANTSYQLSYSPSELKSAESVRALHLRIRRIALAHCPDYSVTRGLNERASCIKDVESDLVSQVDNPLLTKIHTGDATLSIASTSR